MDPNQNQPNVPEPMPPATGSNPPMPNVPPAPQPIPSSPTPMPSPIQPPQPPVVAPSQPVVSGQMSGPVQQPTTEQPTPIGQPMPMNNSAPSPVQTNNKKKGFALRLLITIVIILLTTGGGWILLKDTLFSGTSLKMEDLIEETSGTVVFKRPSQWTQPSGSISPYDIVFTEDGKSMEEADQAVAVMIEAIGGDFDTLTEEQKAGVVDAMIQEFQDPSIFEGDGCKKISGLTVGETTLANYTSAIAIELTCDEIAGRNVKAKLKATIGLSGEEMHLVMTVVLEDTWNKSKDVIDEITTNFRPVL